MTDQDAHPRDFHRYLEYVRFKLIGSPLEAPMQKVRSIFKYRKMLMHPELREVMREHRYLDRILKQVIHDPMNCVDIGCHLGSVLNKMHRYSPRGKHFAFEPLPYKREWLARKYPWAVVKSLALSDCSGEVEFCYQPKRSGFSGLRVHGSPEKAKKVSRFKVKCERLDDVLPNDLDVGFMKVDVEGAELSVFRGSTEVLRRCKPVILFECTRSGLKAFEISPRAIFDFLVEEQGYQIYLPRDWLHGDSPLSYEGFTKAMSYPFQAFNFLACPAAVS